MILTKDGKILTKDGQILTTDGSGGGNYVPLKTELLFSDIINEVYTHNNETDSDYFDFTNIDLNNKYLEFNTPQKIGGYLIITCNKQVFNSSIIINVPSGDYMANLELKKCSYHIDEMTKKAYMNEEWLSDNLAMAFYDGGDNLYTLSLTSVPSNLLVKIDFDQLGYTTVKFISTEIDM